jgi:membrane protease YdiL (CAAX protease family)
MIDLISINAIILAMVLFTYASVWLSESGGYTSIVALILLIGGGFMAYLLGLIRLGSPKMGGLKLNMIWLLGCMGAVYILNWSTTWRALSSEEPLGDIARTVLIGVSEDVFFRGFITAWLIALMGPMLGILLGSGVFTIYHLNVYGGEAMGLMIVFGAGLVLGWAMFYTRSLTAPILAHVLVNFVALGGFLYAGPVASTIVVALLSVLIILLLRRRT